MIRLIIEGYFQYSIELQFTGSKESSEYKKFCNAEDILYDLLEEPITQLDKMIHSYGTFGNRLECVSYDYEAERRDKDILLAYCRKIKQQCIGLLGDNLETSSIDWFMDYLSKPHSVNALPIICEHWEEFDWHYTKPDTIAPLVGKDVSLFPYKGRRRPHELSQEENDLIDDKIRPLVLELSSIEGEKELSAGLDILYQHFDLLLHNLKEIRDIYNDIAGPRVDLEYFDCIIQMIESDKNDWEKNQYKEPAISESIKIWSNT